MQALDLTTLNTRNEAEEQLAEEISDPGVRLFLLKNLTRNKAGAYEWKMNLPVLWQDYPRILSALTGAAFEGPSLFIRGAQSDYIQDTDWPGIRELFPAAELVTVPGAGHWVHADAPDVLLSEIRQFLLAH